MNTKKSYELRPGDEAWFGRVIMIEHRPGKTVTYVTYHPKDSVESSRQITREYPDDMDHVVKEKSLGEQPHDAAHCHVKGRSHLGPCREETNEDWIREIVNQHFSMGADHPRFNPVISALAAEVTSRLAEAYEEGWAAKRHLNREYPS